MAGVGMGVGYVSGRGIFRGFAGDGLVYDGWNGWGGF